MIGSPQRSSARDLATLRLASLSLAMLVGAGGCADDDGGSAPVDAAELADVSDAADLPETATAADAAETSDAGLDAGPDVQWGTIVDGGCPFGGPPQGHPLTLAPPATHTACDEPPSQLDGWQPVGALEVALGTRADDGTFMPFAEGQWQPLVHGIQGGFHISLAIRVRRPGGGALDPDELLLEGYAHVGCEVADAPTVSPIAAAAPDPTDAAALIVGDSDYDGFRWIMPVQSPQSWQFCGRWLRGSLRVYDKASGLSGEARVYLRMYDTNADLSAP